MDLNYYPALSKGAEKLLMKVIVADRLLGMERYTWALLSGVPKGRSPPPEGKLVATEGLLLGKGKSINNNCIFSKVR